jgi:hypothetical protein
VQQFRFLRQLACFYKQPFLIPTVPQSFLPVQSLQQLKVETGKFGTMMQVSIENDGPVTLILEKEANS